MKIKITEILLGASISMGVVACAQQSEQVQSTTSAVTLEHITAPQFQDKINQLPNEQIVDVRTPEEFATGYIRGAVNINIYDADFRQQIEKLDKTRPVLVYCKAGARSADAADIFKASGFTNILDLKGGIMSWTNNSFPLETVRPAMADKFTLEDYQKLISSSQPVLIDYYAPWCGPCKKMEPWLEKLKAEFAGKVRIERINVDEATALTKELKIENIPIITTHKNGKEIAKTSGLQTEDQLRALITELLQ
jgi:thioredoxin